MATTSPEPLLPSSLPSSSGGAAIGLAMALGTTACNGDRVAVSFATASGTTWCTGDGAMSVAAATIARNANKYSNTPFTTVSKGMFIDMHLHGRDVGWPWGLVNWHTPNNACLGALGRTFALFSGYSYGRQRCPINYVSPNTCFAMRVPHILGYQTFSFVYLAFCQTQNLSCITQTDSTAAK